MSRPMINFNVKAFLVSAEELVRADEIERALWHLNNLPAYYRDNEPREITALRNEILERIATPSFYKDSDSSPHVPDMEPVKQTLRWQLLLKDVQELNKRGLTPHIVDYGPGEFWAPVLLAQASANFTYEPIGLSDVALNKMTPLFADHLCAPNPGQPKIFLALEIIEHLWNENEIKIEMLKAQGPCDIVHVSTPKYAYDYNRLNWKACPVLGHLRAYTPEEFFTKIRMMFPEYSDFSLYDSQILHVRCILKSSKLEKFMLDSEEQKVG